MSPAEFAEALEGIHLEDRNALVGSWYWRARSSQVMPPGDWHTWLVMAGRGFGKTRTGAEWVQRAARSGGARIAIVGTTLHEARAVMVEGESGLLRVRADWRPQFEPSLRRLSWPTGAKGFLYSADDPDALRGAQHSHAWGDEIAKWPRGLDVWMNLRMGLRLGSAPRAVLTTTPRPVPLVRRLLEEAMAGQAIVVTRGRTAENAANLPAAFLAAVTEAYGGTRLGRQELDGELIEEVEGALWSRALIERCRVRALNGVQDEGFVRVVIGVDPPAGHGAGSVCGIVAAGLRTDGAIVVIEDASVEGLSPEGWARAVSAAAARHGADRVIAEVNNGGDMVARVLAAVDDALPVKSVRATRGKAIRAEPVAAQYEAGRVHHAGAFPALEDELCGLIAGGGYEGPGRSPDRADALVWAVWALMGKSARPGVRVV
ncbi:terminase family protein [Sphingosinicella sp.]|uniref:DNA-packaging protein n=1 Tax=Sphingosinicella sp. TaxID=1917971 RepID=UPI00262FED2B|nr:terminase family protein [Sphingosinicella sp.]